jgi:hypothetical protein
MLLLSLDTPMLAITLQAEASSSSQKEHRRNKWLRVSSLYLMQSSQVYDSSAMFLLLNITLVFSLFCRSNQKKTLCFI